jgi:hypothetical protein
MFFSVCAGEGILSAVTDVLRISRLHTFLSRALTLMHAAHVRSSKGPAKLNPVRASPPPSRTALGVPAGRNGVIKVEGTCSTSGDQGWPPGYHSQGTAHGSNHVLGLPGQTVQKSGFPGHVPDETTAASQLVWEVSGSGAVQIIAAGPLQSLLLVVPLLPQAEAPAEPVAEPRAQPPSGIKPVPSLFGAPLDNGMTVPKWETIPRANTMDFTAFLGTLGSGLGGPLASFGPTIETIGLLGPRLSSVSNFLVVESPSRSPEKPAARDPSPETRAQTPPTPQTSNVPSLRLCVEWVVLPRAAVAAAEAVTAAEAPRDPGPEVSGQANSTSESGSRGEGARPPSVSGSGGKTEAAPPLPPPQPPGFRLACRLRSTPGLPPGVLCSLEELAGAAPPHLMC